MGQIVSSIVVALLAAAGTYLPFRSVSRSLTVAIHHPKATITGSRDGKVDSFLGIPYAQPPVGQLRLRPPQPIDTDLGNFTATSFPLACPQQIDPSDPVRPGITVTPTNHTHAGEDCLTLNIKRPSSIAEDVKLPVLFWIYGGGFEIGSTQSYDGSDIVRTSIEQNQPIIFVSVNYRVNAFGFLPGKEVKEAGVGNLGLLDQRLGLQWVADNIEQFGGDADKVTIWGESAGAMSVFSQMVLFDGDNTYKGKPLFRGGIMNSGSILPAHEIDGEKGQFTYDSVVRAAGCSTSADTLSCLRTVPYEEFHRAALSVPSFLSYYSVAIFYLPRPDGRVLTASPEVLAQQGKIAPASVIVGEQEDEGTLFASVYQKNITNGSGLVKYAQTILYPHSSRDVVRKFVEMYPDDPELGAPYGTSAENQLYPQHKRLSSLLGDIMFTFPRRALLSLAATASAGREMWSYIATYNHGTPILGTTHGSDLPPAFGEQKGFPRYSIQSYYISFVTTLSPNSGTSSERGGDLTQWPQWTSDTKQLLNLGKRRNTLTKDDYREDRFTYYVDDFKSFRL